MVPQWMSKGVIISFYCKFAELILDCFQSYLYYFIITKGTQGGKHTLILFPPLIESNKF